MKMSSLSQNVVYLIGCLLYRLKFIPDPGQQQLLALVHISKISVWVDELPWVLSVIWEWEKKLHHNDITWHNNRALIAVDSLDGLVPHPTKNMQSENKNTKQRDGSSSKLCQVMQPGLPKPGHDEMFSTQESLHPNNCFSRTPMSKW